MTKENGIFDIMAAHTMPVTLKLIASDFNGVYYDDGINGVIPTAVRRTDPYKYILSNGMDLSIDDDHFTHEYYSHEMFHADHKAASEAGYNDTVIRTLILQRA